MNLKLAFTFVLCLHTQAYSFVLLSGPDEAKIAVSPTKPTIEFVWNGSTINFLAISQDVHAATEELLQEALDTWNEVPGSFIQLVLKKNLEANFDSEDNKFVIGIEELESLSSSAYALPVTDESKITDCDIHLSSKASAVDLVLNTIVHEIGHCLGLGHAHTNPNAIMGYTRSSVSHELGSDDMAGLIYLYPDPSYKSAEKITCASINGKKIESSIVFWLVLLFPLLSSLLVLPRRTRTAKCP